LASEPLCRCHYEPMQRNGFTRRGTQKWRCAVKNNGRFIDRYDRDPRYRIAHEMKCRAADGRRAVEKLARRVTSTAMTTKGVD